jgi:sulfotransferase
MLFLRFEDLTADPAGTLRKVYDYLGIPVFQHDFNQVSQVTQEDDEVFGIPGLHEIRAKVEPSQNDYMQVLGREAVMQVQNQHAWYFARFDYRLAPV